MSKIFLDFYENRSCGGVFGESRDGVFNVVAPAQVSLVWTTGMVITKSNPLPHTSINCSCVRDCYNCQVAATLEYMLTAPPPLNPNYVGLR
jgi:hypothetical protein